MPDFPPRAGASASEIWTYPTRELTSGANITLPSQPFPFTNPASPVDLSNLEVDGLSRGKNPTSPVDLTNLQVAISPTGTGREAKLDSIQQFVEEGVGTLTADGTEQIVREITNIVGKVHAYIDLSNMASGDTVVIREYIMIKEGGSYIKYHEETYSGAQVLPLLHIIMKPAKYGLKITLQQTAGTYRTFDWETFIERAVA